MLIFIILTVTSFVFYLYFKVKVLQTKKPMEKRRVNTIAKICLGFFLIFFSLNQLFADSSTMVLIIGNVFLLLGGVYVVQNYRAYRYYLPLAIEEAEKEKQS